MSETIAVWFSCGAASAVAAKLTLERFPEATVRVVNNPRKDMTNEIERLRADLAAANALLREARQFVRWFTPREDHVGDEAKDIAIAIDAALAKGEGRT